MSPAKQQQSKRAGGRRGGSGGRNGNRPASNQGPPPSSTHIQKILDENACIIQTIRELQFAGKANECMSYQMALHLNLIYLADLADPHAVWSQSLPPTHDGSMMGQGQMSGYSQEQQEGQPLTSNGADWVSVPSAGLAMQPDQQQVNVVWTALGQNVVTGGPNQTGQNVLMGESGNQEQNPGHGDWIWTAGGIAGSQVAQQEQLQQQQQPLPSETSSYQQHESYNVPHSHYPGYQPPNQAPCGAEMAELLGICHGEVIPPTASAGGQLSPTLPNPGDATGQFPGAGGDAAGNVGGMGTHQQGMPPGISQAQPHIDYGPHGQPLVEYLPQDGTSGSTPSHGYTGNSGSVSCAEAEAIVTTPDGQLPQDQVDGYPAQSPGYPVSQRS